MTNLNGKIHVIGGMTSSGETAVHEVYDPQTDTWQNATSLPVARSDLAVVTVGNKLYAIGGWNFSLGGAVGYNHVYDPSSDTWITATNMITPVSGAGVAVVSDTIYIIGGWDNLDEISTVQSYNPISDTWLLKSPKSTARSELGAVSFGGKIYAVGGNSPEDPWTSDTVEVYDPASDSWSIAASLPISRTDFAIAPRDNMIYVFGGTAAWEGSVGFPENTSFVYEPNTNTWSSTTPMPIARQGCRAVTVGNLIYVIGGSYGEEKSDLNQAYGYKVINLPLVIR